MLRNGRSLVWIPTSSLVLFSIYLSPPSAIWPWGYSAPNRNEYQKFFWAIKQSRRVRLTISAPSVSQLSRKCGIIDISQSYRHPRPVTGIALILLLPWKFVNRRRLVPSTMCYIETYFNILPNLLFRISSEIKIEMHITLWTGLIWLRMGISGWVTWTRLWSFGFHQIQGSSWVTA
jgi:hypothetical protein